MADKRIDELTEILPNELTPGMWLAIGRDAAAARKLNTNFLLGQVPYDQQDYIADDVLLDTESGKLCTNIGAPGIVTLDAPPATVGLWYMLLRSADFAFRFNPTDLNSIETGVPGAYLELQSPGTIVVKCVVAGIWTPYGGEVTWDVEEP